MTHRELILNVAKLGAGIAYLQQINQI